MDYRYLGRTGLKVSELCLGTMTFGAATDEATGHQMLDRFVDVGGTFIDTADVYSAGKSEEILGTLVEVEGPRLTRHRHQGLRRHGSRPE